MVSKTFFSSPHYDEETPSMIAIRRHPYPKSGLDMSLFEDVTEEYVSNSTSHSLEPRSYAHARSQDLLLKLVREGDIADAYRVREEMKKMGIYIRPSYAYAKAALRALTAEGIDDTERANSFMGWWTHLPYRRQGVGSFAQVRLLRKLLYRDTVPNIPLIIRCALTLAASGHEPRISRSAIPIVVRQSHPDLTLTFLEKYKKADLQSRQDQYSRQMKTSQESIESHTQVHQARFAKVYGLAVRTHCSVGRLSAAVTLLEAALDLELPVNEFTFEFLLFHLQRKEDMAAVKLVTSWLHENEASQAQAQKGEGQQRSFRTKFRKAHALSKLPKVKHHPPSYLPLARTTAALKALVLSHGRPSPEAFKDFIKLHDVQEDVDALRSLRKALRMMRPSETVLSSWLCAELSILVNHLRYDEALRLFANNFWTTGAPTHIRERARQMKHGAEGRWSKLWPTSHHLSLIWRIAISQADSFPELKKLYQELCWLASVRIAEGQTVAIGRDHLSSEVSTAPIQFDDIIFAHFVDAFTHKGVIMTAVSVPLDLARLQIPLSTTFLRALVKSLTRMRTFGRVLNLLRKLDHRASRAKPKTAASFHNILVSGREVLCDVSHPLIPVYLAAIIRFRLANREDCADAFVQRLKIQTSGVGFDVDQVLERLHDVGFKGVRVLFMLP